MSQKKTNPRHFNIYNLTRSVGDVGATLVQEVQPFSLSLLGCNFSWKHFNSISVANIRTSVGRGQEVMWHADRKIQWWWLSSRKSQHMDFNQLTPKKKTSEKIHVNLIFHYYTHEFALIWMMQKSLEGPI